PLPSPGFEAVRSEEEPAGDDHAEDLRVRERPAVLDELARRQNTDSRPDDGGNDVERDAGAPCAENAQETWEAHLSLIGHGRPKLKLIRAMPTCTTDPRAGTPPDRVIRPPWGSTCRCRRR